MEQIKLREDYIKLGQALKAAGLVDSGVDAKNESLDGKVKVNGSVELQRGKSFMTEIWWNTTQIRSKLRSKL
jgi:ribosome-associated protein